MEIRGLKNYTNSCYLNTCLQSLIPFFNILFPDITSFKDEHSKLLYYTLYHFYHGNPQKLNTLKNRLQKVVQKTMGDPKQDTHKDAFECLLALLNMVPKQTIDLYYTGLMSRITQCNECKTVKKNPPESFEHWVIPVSPTLIQSINEYFSPQKVELNCDKCAKTLIHTSQFKLQKTPTLIYIILNRFELRSNKFVKNVKPVNIPLNVVFEGNSKYQLVFAGIHEGSVNWGHYYACVKKSDGWYIINDSRISRIQTIQELKNQLKNAYFLLFQKKNIEEKK